MINPQKKHTDQIYYYHHISIYNSRNVRFVVQSQENYNKININHSPSPFDSIITNNPMCTVYGHLIELTMIGRFLK